MKFRLSLLAGCVVSLAVVSSASAHITLRIPAPRTAAPNGQKGPPPCGTLGPAKPNEYRPGESIMVEFQETIPHPGRFRIALAPRGTTFPNPMTVKDTNTTLPLFIDGLFPKNGGGGATTHRQMITFPSTPCDDCVLQILQVMKVNPPYASGADQDIYYQCADIVLKGAPMGGPDAGADAMNMPDTGTGGAGGAGGAGGSGGSGGSTGGSGGASGGSGGAYGGSGGSGGSTGGSGGSTGGSSVTGGSGGSGGSGSGGSTGGRGGSGSGTGGSTTTKPPGGGGAAGGCSVAGTSPSTLALGFAGLMLGLALRRRRSR